MRWGIVIAIVLHASVLMVPLRPGSTALAEIVRFHPVAFPAPEPVSRSVPPTGPAVTPIEPIHFPTVLPLPGKILGVADPPAPAFGPTGIAVPSVPVASGWTVDPLAESLVQEPPVLLQAPLPAYPPRMRDAGIEGSVLVEAVVDTLGRVEPGSMRIVHSDRAEFAAPAAAAIGAALFRPARVFGRPVRVLVRVPVGFRLR